MTGVPPVGSWVPQCSCASCSGLNREGPGSNEVAPAVCSGLFALSLALSTAQVVAEELISSCCWPGGPVIPNSSRISLPVLSLFILFFPFFNTLHPSWHAVCLLPQPLPGYSSSQEKLVLLLGEACQPGPPLRAILPVPSPLSVHEIEFAAVSLFLPPLLSLGRRDLSPRFLGTWPFSLW